MGDAVLELLMRRENVWPGPKRNLDFFVVIIGNYITEGLRLVKMLRENGFSADYDPDFRSVQKQMKMAEREGARFSLIMGEEELKNNTVTMKDMDSGVQNKIGMDDLIQKLRKYNLPKNHFHS